MSKSRRFVILTHDHPVLHWDLMLDTGNALRTWRLEQEPQVRVELRAVALPDHRREYLDYEGPVSGDRGMVTQWDTGTYMTHEESSRSVAIVVSGGRINGIVELVNSNDGDEWLFLLREASVER